MAIYTTVALLAEGVDRNLRYAGDDARIRLVALLAEGVDRNHHSPAAQRRRNRVALLAEGVDRNNNYLGTEGVELMSPSSRRAWIEIPV